MGSLFSVPKPPKPVEMPDPDNKLVKNDYAKQIAAARQRGGRASTILSGDDSYAGSTTGAP